MSSAQADIEDVQPRPSPAAPDWGSLLGLLQGSGVASGQGGPAAMAAPGTDPLAQLQSRLDALATDNPAMAAMLQMLQRPAPAPPSAAPPAEPDPDRLSLGPQERADLQELLVQSSAMEQELGTLRARNDALAAALGACYLCFGEHENCLACRGQGNPGSWRSDPDAFRRYVAPVLRRVHRETLAGVPRNPSPSPAPAGAPSQSSPDYQKGRPVP